MIDTLLALVPTYGVWLIAICVALSCLALPIPSSMLVMAAGGFAAAGDFSYWQLVGFAFIGFLCGDQVAFFLARTGGAPLLNRVKSKPAAAKILTRAEDLIARRGVFAVILSRTFLSPIGPYVAYLSGALHLGWAKFTTAAAFGAALWCLGYSWLGFTFANRIDEIAALISDSVGVIFAAGFVIGIIAWLRRSYRREQARKTA